MGRPDGAKGLKGLSVIVTFRIGAAAALCAIGCMSAIAQTPSHLSDAEPAPPSRWAADAGRLDEQIRLRLLSASPVTSSPGPMAS